MLSDIKGLIAILRATHAGEVQLSKYKKQYLEIIAYQTGPVTSSKTLKAVD